MEAGSSSDVPIGVILAIIGISLPLTVALAVWIVKKLYELTTAIAVVTEQLKNVAADLQEHRGVDDDRFARRDRSLEDHEQRLRSSGH